ncbi:MAG: hypothetical protein IKU15_00650 [Clostridia bacterium]|nr:hypothetical protein [Clostridia bacterium]MBR4889810.1 hypothetical protein [Clostridia bacterium]
MEYNNLIDNVGAQMAAETAVKPQINTSPSASREKDESILNMIALEVQRQGGN